MGADDRLFQRASRRLGTTLRGKYRLDRVLGVGGTAAVYAATNVTVGRECAVKVLHAELALVPELSARFLKEGRATNAIKHPGVVDVLDGDVDEEGTAFFVLELLEGQPVDVALRRNGGVASVRSVLRLGYLVCEVLEAAHAKGVIHRDIKPGNLFVTRAGRLKVLDFGIARVRTGQSGTGTETGLALGTPAFMSPEQSAGKGIGASTDLWSVGATLFTLLSGENVHRAESPQALVIASATEPARSLATVAPETPAAVVALVDRALRSNPAERWPSAQAMADECARVFRETFAASIVDEPLVDPADSAPALPAAPVTAVDPTVRMPSSLTTDLTSADAPAPAPRARRVPVGLVALGAAVALGVVVLALQSRFESHATASSEPARVATTPSAVESAPPSLPTADTSVALAPSAPPAVTPNVTATTRASAAAAPRPNRGVASAAPVKSSSPVAMGPSCTPNYVLDVDGNKHFKPECF